MLIQIREKDFGHWTLDFGLWLTVCKRPVDHFTPKMTNSYVGLLDSRRPVGGNDDGEVAVGRQRFPGAAR